jgi:hypothetical protein
MGAVSDLVQRCPNEFLAVSSVVLAAIANASSGLGDLVEYLLDDTEDDEVDVEVIIVTFMRTLLVCLNVTPDAESVIGIIIGIMEVVGGMKEHGDDLLAISVEAMWVIIQKFGDRAVEILGDEIGFEMLVREAGEAGLMTDAINDIISFMARDR